MKPEQWHPHEYQLKSIRFVLECFVRENSSALFLQPGMGKTSVTLEVFKLLKAAGKVKKLLVVAPLRVAQSTWPVELSRWLNFVGLTHVVLHGLHKDRLLLKDVDIYIINYEGLHWLLGKTVVPKFDMLVFDELSRMKSWTSKRVKEMKPFLPTFKYRLGLTGTPIANGYEDLFSQIYMLDRGKRFGHRKTKYMDMYFEPSNIYSYKRVLRRGGDKLILSKIENLCFSLRSDDWLQLPEELYSYNYLELTSQLRLKYNELKKEAIIELQNAKVVTAQTAAVLTSKLRQFLSGYIYIEDKAEHIHDIKYEYVKEFIEDLGEPILIAYQYRHEAARLKQIFSDIRHISSTMQQTSLNETIKQWNAGQIKILMGHPQSIGHGLNLQGGGRHILFFSIDYNLETYQQFIKRLSRQGQSAEHVFIHHLLFKETIDEHILKVLQGKDIVQANLLEFLTNET